MTQQVTRSVSVSSSRDRALRDVQRAFGFLHSCDDGETLSCHDGERRMIVTYRALSEGSSNSLDAAGRMEFAFVGYSDEEADVLLEQYREHALHDVSDHLSRAPGDASRTQLGG